MSTTSDLAGLIPVVVAAGVVKRFSETMLSGKSGGGSRSGRKKKGRRTAGPTCKQCRPF